MGVQGGLWRVKGGMSIRKAAEMLSVSKENLRFCVANKVADRR